MKKRIVTVVLLVVMILSSFTTTAMAFSPELVGKEPGGFGARETKSFVMSSSALTTNTDAVGVRTLSSFGKLDPSKFFEIIPTIGEFFQNLREVISVVSQKETLQDKLKAFVQKAVPLAYEYYVRITELWKAFLGRPV